MDIQILNNIFLRTHRAFKPKADLWFIHGFADSGLCFREAFSSKLADSFNLFVPDCPGFGVSPLPNKALTVEETAETLQNLMEKVSDSNRIGIVAHSLGGLIGTWLCQKFSQQVIGFINVEGNLTQADCFFSGKTNDFVSAQKFYTFFTQEILRLISERPQDEALKRYYASIRLAHPEALFQWGQSGVKATGMTKGGEEFSSLKCKAGYFWGDKSTPEETKNFIQKKKLKNICFKNSGHVPMIDATDVFYEKVGEFFL